MSLESFYSEIYGILHNDIVEEQQFPARKPLLAHYTSLQNLENILSREEVWLSSPLHMNDLEEVRFGMLAGKEEVSSNQEIRDALETRERHERFLEAFYGYFDSYARDGVLDLYIFCLSEHESADQDGKLSMWRGYGQNGNGAAIIFDTGSLDATEDNPLFFSPVSYGTREARRAHIELMIRKVSTFLATHKVSDEEVFAVAHALFSRLRLFSVCTKHIGFKEELEWRLVYQKENDEDGKLSPYLGYHNGPAGIHPKLKLPLRPIPGVISENFSLSSLINTILIGPTASSPLAYRGLKIMLEKINKPELVEKIKMSNIPFRA